MRFLVAFLVVALWASSASAQCMTKTCGGGGVVMGVAPQTGIGVYAPGANVRVRRGIFGGVKIAVRQQPVVYYQPMPQLYYLQPQPVYYIPPRPRVVVITPRHVR